MCEPALTRYGKCLIGGLLDLSVKGDRFKNVLLEALLPQTQPGRGGGGLVLDAVSSKKSAKLPFKKYTPPQNGHIFFAKCAEPH